MKKAIFILFIILATLIAACQKQDTKIIQAGIPTVQEVQEPKQNEPSAQQPIAEANSAQNQTTNQIPAQEPSSNSGKKVVKEFSIEAKRFEYNPSTIEVNKGDVVTLKINSMDVSHGFNLPDFNIDERIEPGKETVIQFTADKTGEFEFHCNFFCGSGHPDMKGKLIVR